MSFDTAQWGTVADWIAALGSAGALFAAVHLIRSESNQRRVEEEDRRWAQARLVTITAHAPRSGFSARDAEGNQVHVGPFSYDATARIVNSSTLPLHNLEVQLFVEDTLVMAHSKPVLLPGGMSEVTGRLQRVADSDLSARATLAFVDALGHAWRLGTDEPLRRRLPDD